MAGRIDVLVQVVPKSSDRQISWSATPTLEHLDERIKELQTAIARGVHAVFSGLPEQPTDGQWSLEEVSTSFGVTLAAEAGVILSRASAEATLEVALTFRRNRGGVE